MKRFKADYQKHSGTLSHSIIIIALNNSYNNKNNKKKSRRRNKNNLHRLYD